MNEPALQARSIYATRSVLATDIVIIIVLWCASAVIVNPVGEFPIIDDWLYKSIVEALLETGRYPNTEPATMTLVANVLWGALFCLPFGVSFTALRVSTLSASLFGILGVYILARDLHQSRFVRLVAALTLAFSPAYYALSHSFMTDVPFTAVTIWSAVFLARSLKSGSKTQMFFGAVLAVVATLSRQTGLAIPIAFAVISSSRRGVTWRAIFIACGPIVLCAAGLLLFYHFLAVTERLPTTYNLYSNLMVGTLTHFESLVTVPLINTYGTLVSLGLFLLPLAFSGVRDLFRVQGKGWLFLTGIGVVAIVLCASVRAHFSMSNLLPLPESHILVNSGIGLLWLQESDRVPSLPYTFWVSATVMAVLGAVFLIAEFSIYALALVSKFLNRSHIADSETAGMFLVICGLILLIPYLAVGSADRYLVACLPFFGTGLIGLSGSLPETVFGLGKSPRIVASVLLVAFGLFAVCGTKDYLAWHRASSRGSLDLMQSTHVLPEDIDGGIEFDALYPAHPNRDDVAKQVDELARTSPMYVFSDEVRKQLEAILSASWRPSSVKYVVSFGPVQGYSTVGEYSYYNWAPPHVQRILVLRNESVPSNPPRDLE